MYKVPVALALVVVDVHAELGVPLRLLQAEVKLPHPILAASVHELVKLLEAGEEGTRRRPDDQQRFLPLDGLPTSCAIGCQVEVKAILVIHGHALLEAILLAELPDAFWTEHFNDVGTLQLRAA